MIEEHAGHPDRRPASILTYFRRFWFLLVAGRRPVARAVRRRLGVEAFRFFRVAGFLAAFRFLGFDGS
jgi:hypothetical protein